MRCQNCGRELRNGARFCIACGAQHDENGQLVGGGNQAGNQGGNQDYNKTMMMGSTGFKQYSEADNAQNFQQYDYDYANANMGNDVNVQNTSSKKKISPVLIICPIIIVIALLVSVLGGKSKKSTKKVGNSQSETTIVKEENKDIKESVKEESAIKETSAIATISIATQSEPKEKIHLKGYWSADADYFYIDGEMQKNLWVEDYYVGSDGRKVTNDWIDNKYYVDATGKKARNEWIEFSFYGEDGQKKSGFYYVDEEGLKVTNKTIDGRYLDEVGCYWPNGEEKNKDLKEDSEEKETKELNKNDANAKESKQETKKETEHETTIIQTTIRETTTIAPIVNTQNTNVVVPETTIQSVNQQLNNTKAVASDGKSVAYQITEIALPDENITKYVNLNVNDAKYTNLAVSVNEWNNNRSHQGVNKDGSILGNTVSMVYDISVERNDGKVFSIIETMSKYDNGKLYDKKRVCVTWDTNSGEMLSLESVFNDEDKYKEFADKAKSRIKSSKNSIEEDIYEELINSEDATDIFEYCSWYMSNTGIVLLFDKDKIGSSKVDGISITLTYSESGSNVKKLLKTKYRY